VCTYDLEPVTNTMTMTTVSCQQGQAVVENGPACQQSRRIFNSVATARVVAIDAFSSTDPQAAQMPLMADGDTFRWIAAQMKQIPVLVQNDQSSPFIHAQVAAGRRERTAQTHDVQIMSVDVATRHWREMLQSNLDGRPPFEELLYQLHHLLARLITLMCPTDELDDTTSETKKLIQLFLDWTEELYNIAPTEFGSEASPWQAWVVAESIRRTMLAAVMIRGLDEALENGVCVYRPFVESLPFDLRSGLWEAATEQEWQDALASHHGGQHSQLMSWHEFIESGGPEPRPEYDGMLQRILLVAYHGTKALQPSRRS